MVDEYRKGITYSKKNNKKYDEKQNYQRKYKAILQNNKLHNYKYLIN